ncbi:hypothetical protein CGCVW01_v010068 [Colletotrichum viniferum]|nr:hypothetical protein CGCVW01_v010068 [Colletotrichum viniferum]
MRTQLRQLFFHLQTSDAIAILFLATQESRHSWASVLTASGLMIWILVSFILLLEFKDYLIERAPWSVIAIIIPVSIWIAIFTTKDIDVYYAGLFTPIWITIGLNILAIYDGKNRIRVQRQPWKDKIDLESGPRHATGSDGILSRPSLLRST